MSSLRLRFRHCCQRSSFHTLVIFLLPLSPYATILTPDIFAAFARHAILYKILLAMMAMVIIRCRATREASASEERAATLITLA